MVGVGEEALVKESRQYKLNFEVCTPGPRRGLGSHKIPVCVIRWAGLVVISSVDVLRWASMVSYGSFLLATALLISFFAVFTAVNAAMP